MIKRLDWDSDFFGIKIGELIYEPQVNLENSIDFDLLYLKGKENFELEITNFINNFSETKLIFIKKLIENHFESSNIFSVNEIGNKTDEIYELAFESGKYSRFFLDKNFKLNKFQELYRKWVDNSILKIFADETLIYKEDNQVMGFITYKINNEMATIGLIAVHPNFQGKGIGSKLLQFVENKLSKKKVKKLLIPTQQNNVAACNFYKKQGYKIYETTFVKHYWKEEFSQPLLKVQS